MSRPMMRMRRFMLLKMMMLLMMIAVFACILVPCYDAQHHHELATSDVDNSNEEEEEEEEEKRVVKVQLAFGIMVYQKPKQPLDTTLSMFYRLMDEIYDDENHFYVIHVDVKSDPRLITAINEDFCAQVSNCVSITPRNVGWAGMTTGEMMLALMQTAVEQATVQWEYFTNVGHESVPLMSLRYMEGYLASYPPGTNFVNCWRVDGYDFFGQWENNVYRLEQIVVEDFNGGLIENDQINSKTRLPPNDITFYKSIQLMMLSRDFVKYAVYGINTRRVMLYLANVKTSDEMLIPTLLQIDPVFAKTATCNFTLHYTHWIRPGGSWHPEYLTLEHLPRLLNTSKHLFVRKIDPFDPNNVGISHHLTLALKKIRLDGYDQFKTDAQVDDDEVEYAKNLLSRSDSSSINKRNSDSNNNINSNTRNDDSRNININFQHSATVLSSRTILQRPAFVASRMQWIVPLGIDYIMELHAKSTRVFDSANDADNSIMEALETDAHFGLERTDLSVANWLVNNTRVPFASIVEYSIRCGDSMLAVKTQIIDDIIPVPAPPSSPSFSSEHFHDADADPVCKAASSLIAPMHMLLLLEDMQAFRDQIEINKMRTIYRNHANMQRQQQQQQQQEQQRHIDDDDEEEEEEEEEEGNDKEDDF